ncbi:MAG: DUF805 domain-containing protein [Rhodospirillales bacterium]
MAEDEAEAEGGKKSEAETAPEAGETPEPVTEQQPRPEAGPGAGETPAEIAGIEAEPEAGPGAGETPAEAADQQPRPETGPEVEAEAEPETEEKAEQEALEPSGGETDDASVNGEAPGEETARQTLAFRWILFSFQGRIARSVYWLRGILPIFAVTFVLPLAMVILSMALGLQQKAAPTAIGLFILSTDHGQVSVKDASGLAGVKVSAGETPSEQPDVPSFEKTVDTGIFRLTAVQTLAGKPDKEKIRWRFSPAREADERPLFVTIVAVTAGIVLFFFFFWTSLAVGAKRCHDRGRSGWFQLISLIPLIGSLWLLVELGFLKGKEGENRFGPDPLA